MPHCVCAMFVFSYHAYALWSTLSVFERRTMRCIPFWSCFYCGFLSLPLFFACSQAAQVAPPSPPSTACANVSGNERQHLKRQALNWQIDGWFSLHVHGYMMYYYAGARRRDGGREREGNYVKSCRLSDAQRSPKCFISPSSFELCLRGSFELIVSRFAFSLFVSSFVRSFVSFWFLRSVACFLFCLSFCSCNGARP